MKKTAIIFGAIGICIFFLSILFKLMHWPGAGLMITWGNIFNFIIVIPIIIAYSLSKEFSGGKIYFLGAISVFMWFGGGFFKIMHWPGAGILLTLGTLSIVIFTILLAIKLYKE